MPINYTSLYGQIRTFFREYTAEETHGEIRKSLIEQNVNNIKYWLTYGKEFIFTASLYREILSFAIDNDCADIFDHVYVPDNRKWLSINLDINETVYYHMSLAERKINMFKYCFKKNKYCSMIKGFNFYRTMWYRKINIYLSEFINCGIEIDAQFSEKDRVFIDQVSDFLHSLGKTYIDFNVHGTGLEVYLRRNDIKTIDQQKLNNILPKDLVGDIIKYY